MKSSLNSKTDISNNVMGAYENDRKSNWVVSLDDKDHINKKYYNDHFWSAIIDDEQIIDINKNVIIDENILSSFVISISDKRRLEMIQKLKYSINFIESVIFPPEADGMEKSRLLGLNHINCWKMAHKMNLDGAFFFEDDIIFIKNWRNVVNKFIKEYSPDVIRFDSFPTRVFDSHSCDHIKFYKDIQPWCTGGCYLSKKAITYLHNYFDDKKWIWRTCELAFAEAIQKFHATIYTSTPKICIQDWFRQTKSSIQNKNNINILGSVQKNQYLPIYKGFYENLNDTTKIIVGSEGMGIWGKKFLTFFLKKLGFSDIEYKNSDECDIIISSHFFPHENKWNNKKKIYIYFSGERLVPPVSTYAENHIYIITTIEKNLNNNIYMPYFLKSPYINKKRKHINLNREYLLAYCNSNCVPLREQIFDLFVKKSGVSLCHSYGSCFGSYPETNNKIEGKWNNIKLIDTYKNYTFVIAMENHQLPGYVTEKIINAFYSGAIPIYWGASNINEFFNPKAFINVSNFSSLNECVDFVCNMSQVDIVKMTLEPIYNESNELVNIFTDKLVNNKTLESYIEIFKRVIL